MIRRKSCRAVIGFCLGLWLNGPDAAAQLPATPKAEELGLRIPLGARVEPGDGRRVLVLSEQSSASPVVAKVHVAVGDRLLLRMPDGTLRSVPASETTVTDRPFVAADKKALSEQLAAEFPGFNIRATRRYLYAYNTSSAFYTATSRILESMHPHLVAFCERHDLASETLENPLIVVMFRTKAEFQAYRPMRDSVLAYYNSVSNRVIMYEQLAWSRTAPTIAMKQLIGTIAHEGVHQVLHNIGVQQRLASWPMWISEGLAEYFAPTEVERRVKWKGVGRPNDLRMRELLEFARQAALERRDGDVVRAVIQEDRLTSTGYAWAWALTHYLATREKDRFLDYLRDVSALAPLSEGEDELTRFTRYFGDDFAKLQAEMLRHVRGLDYVDPVENQPHYLVVATTPRRKLAVMTSSPLAAKQARGELLAKLPPAERRNVRFSVQTFPHRSAAERAMQWLSRGR